MSEIEANVLPERRTWNYQEASAYLGISVSTLRKKVMMSRVPHLKPFGSRGRVLFLREDLEKFLDNSRIKSDN